MKTEDTFLREVIKILLDKGLLAIIVTFLVYRLNELLEKFKARNAKDHVLFTYQVKAYNDILESLLNHNNSKQRFLETLYDVQNWKKQSPEITEFEQSEEYIRRTGKDYRKDLELSLDSKKNQFADDLDELNKVFKRNALFMSGEFVSKIKAYTDSLEISYIIGKNTEDALIERLSDVESYALFMSLQNSMLNEVSLKNGKQ